MRRLLEQIKEQQGLTNEQLAVLLNIPVAWMTEILEGKRKLHKHKIKQLKKSIKGAKQ